MPQYSAEVDTAVVDDSLVSYLIRRVEQAVTFIDLLLSMIGIRLFNTSALSDTFGRISSFKNTITNTFAYLDYITRAWTAKASILQSATILDFVSSIRSFKTSLLNTMDLSGIVSKYLYRRVSENLAYLDYITRIWTSKLSMIETPILQDYLIRINAFKQALSNAMDLTDSVIRIFSTKMIISDNIAYLDYLTSSWTVKLALLDTMNIIDYIGSLLSLTATLLEQFILIDSVTWISSFSRTFEENTILADIIGTIGTLKLQITESIMTLWQEFQYVELNFFLSEMIEAITMIDYMSTRSTIKRLLTESITLTHIRSTIQTAFKRSFNTFNISETMSRSWTTKNLIDQAMTIVDSIITYSPYTRSFLESLSLSEDRSSILTAIRNPIESITLSDSYNSVRAFYRTLENNSVSFVDYFVRISVFKIVVDFAATITDVIDRISSTKYVISETADMIDYITSIRSFYTVLENSMSILSENINIVAFKRTLDGTMDYVDNFLSQINYYGPTILESITMIDISPVFNIMYVIEATIGYADELITSLGSVISMENSIDISDIMESSTNFVRDLGDSINILDFVSTVSGLFTHVTEFIDITDVIEYVSTFKYTITDTMDVIASIPSRASLITIDQLAEITDSFSRISTIFYEIQQDISLVDAFDRTFNALVALLDIVEIWVELRAYKVARFVEQFTLGDSVLSTVRMISDYMMTMVREDFARAIEIVEGSSSRIFILFHNGLRKIKVLLEGDP